MEQQKSIRVFLLVLKVIETFYLFSFFFVLYLSLLPHYQGQQFIQGWIEFSYLLLPLLLFKNILVALLNNGILNRSNKIWLLVRCVLYVLLTFISYPIIK